MSKERGKLEVWVTATCACGEEGMGFLELHRQGFAPHPWSEQSDPTGGLSMHFRSVRLPEGWVSTLDGPLCPNCAPAWQAQMEADYNRWRKP